MRSVRFAVLLVLALLVVVGGGVAGVEGTSGGWFDMANCEMCAPMMAEKGLMEHMKWESFAIATGLVDVVTVHADYEEAYARAMGKCHALGEKLMQGEKLHLCGSCAAMAQLMEQGVKMDQVHAGGAHMMLLTATDPSLIEKIHAYRDKNTEEMAKMSQEK